MLGQHEVIGVIEKILEERGLPRMQGTFGGWKLGKRLHIGLTSGGCLAVWEESEDGYHKLSPLLQLPAHPRYARDFAQDVAELVPTSM